MTDRCVVALQHPLARADQGMHERYWRRLCVEGRWLSSIVTINK